MNSLNNYLRQVNKPARYAGGEWNSIVKGWNNTPIRVVLAYPDLYELGMSNMALPILYQLLNQQPDVLAERVFAPWPDMENVMKTAAIPLYSLESRHPLADFDIIGFSLEYELTYTNVLNMLELAKLPPLAHERDDSHPLVIAGGSCALNPEPMSDFIDLFVIGEGEEVLLELIDVIRSCKGKNAYRKELLLHLATIPGVYVPSLYNVKYQPDGLLKSLTPAVPQAKSVIERRIVTDLLPPVTRPVVPYIEAILDRGAVELQRGCSRGCRFCQAGTIYRPVRERSKEEVVNAVGELIANCGYNEVSLVSLSTSDYSGISELVAELSHRYQDHNLTLSLPSLRIDSFSVKLMESFPSHRKTGLTFAPEAGTERLRRVINKDTPEDKMLETVSAALERGWTNFKLYFMLGLPTETDDDVEGIVRLTGMFHQLDSRVKSRRPRVTVSLSTFVPKPHTPFQWVGQEVEANLTVRHEHIRRGLQRLGIKLSWQKPEISLLEAVLSRGDRQLGKVIHRAWQLGATFDAWSEHFNYQNWLRAFSESGLEPGFYAQRERSLDELLPWSHIDIGVTTDYLKREYQRSRQGENTPDCRYDPCNACGLERHHPACQKKLGN